MGGGTTDMVASARGRGVYALASLTAAGLGTPNGAAALTPAMETLLTASKASEVVVLLHGLGRTKRAMAPIAEALEQAGYRTLNRSYESRRHHIESLARAVLGVRLAELRTWDPAPTRVHFVTHSLGGILVRWYANHIGLPEGGRAVMIAPPHAGSEAADALQPLRPAQWWFGPVLQELGTGDGSVPLTLGPVAGLDVGVIAGDRATYPFFNRRFEDAHDGLVSVSSTRVEGASDAIVVPASHSFIAAQPVTIHQAVHFIRHGHFDHAALAQAA